MNDATPKMQTHIQRDRYGLFATVTVIDSKGRSAITTMQPGVKPSDLNVINFKRRIANMKPLKEVS